MIFFNYSHAELRELIDSNVIRQVKWYLKLNSSVLWFTPKLIKDILSSYLGNVFTSYKKSKRQDVYVIPPSVRILYFKARAILNSKAYVIGNHSHRYHNYKLYWIRTFINPNILHLHKFIEIENRKIQKEICQITKFRKYFSQMKTKKTNMILFCSLNNNIV